jgi:hypothetical protein
MGVCVEMIVTGIANENGYLTISLSISDEYLNDKSHGKNDIYRLIRSVDTEKQKKAIYITARQAILCDGPRQVTLLPNKYNVTSVRITPKVALTWTEFQWILKYRGEQMKQWEEWVQWTSKELTHIHERNIHAGITVQNFSSELKYKPERKKEEFHYAATRATKSAFFSFTNTELVEAGFESTKVNVWCVHCGR